MRVSEEAVARAIEELVISREQRSSIQKMNSSEMTTYLVGVYRSGFEDGAEAMFQQSQAEVSDEVKRDWEDVLAMIGEVKGVGPKLLSTIDEYVRRKME